MNNNNINVNQLKAIIVGALAILLQMGFFYIIWMNPFVNDISLQFADHPAVKPYEYFGGLDNWMRLRTIYLILMLSLMIKVFLMFYTNLPGKGWQKGIYFGLILSIIKVIPDAFDTWTLIVYPNELIILQLINGSIGYVFFGLMISFLYHRFNVIQLQPSTLSTDSNSIH